MMPVKALSPVLSESLLTVALLISAVNAGCKRAVDEWPRPPERYAQVMVPSDVKGATAGRAAAELSVVVLDDGPDQWRIRVIVTNRARKAIQLQRRPTELYVFLEPGGGLDEDGEPYALGALVARWNWPWTENYVELNTGESFGFEVGVHKPKRHVLTGLRVQCHYEQSIMETRVRFVGKEKARTRTGYFAD